MTPTSTSSPLTTKPSFTCKSQGLRLAVLGCTLTDIDIGIVDINIDIDIIVSFFRGEGIFTNKLEFFRVKNIEFCTSCVAKVIDFVVRYFATVITSFLCIFKNSWFCLSPKNSRKSLYLCLHWLHNKIDCFCNTRCAKLDVFDTREVICMLIYPHP